MKIERYKGHIIGWSTKKKKYLIDALTTRAIAIEFKDKVPD